MSSPTSPAAEQASVVESPAPQKGVFFRVFPSIMLPMFLAAVDQTIVATALPDIAGELGDVGRVSWVVVAYLIAATITAAIYGRLGDALGRKRLMFFALGMFIAASLLCAVSTSVLMLTFARVLQGLGGGGLMTLSQALVGEAVPPRQRAAYQGYLASVFMASSTFGPVAGGWLTRHYGWPSVFLINVPLGLLAVGLVARLRARPGTGGPLRFDHLGVVLFTLFVTPLLLALERAQTFDLSAVPTMVGLIVVSGISLWFLVRQEKRATSPLLPLKLLRQPAIWRSDVLAMCVGATLVSLVTFVPIYLQVVRGIDPARVGLLLLPLTLFIAVGSLLTGQIISKTGRTAPIPSFAYMVVVAGLLVLAFLAPRLPLAVLPVIFAVTSMCMGTAMPVVQMTTQIVAGPKNLGSAAASVQISRSVGAAFGVATVGAVLFAVLAGTDRDAASLFAQIVQAGPGVLARLDDARRAVVQSEIEGAFRAAFLTVAAFAATGLTLAWSIPMRRL